MLVFNGLEDYRSHVRAGKYKGHTSGLFADLAQANIVILPQEYAADFALFCQKNPKPCPIIYTSSPGNPELSGIGSIDIRQDVPLYRVYRGGNLSEEVTDITKLWQSDMICFCIGCSFTFDAFLMASGIRIKHVEDQNNVAMYRSNVPLLPSLYFSGFTVVSMRWILRDQVDLAVNITERFPDFHGSPIHIGEPEKIGINDITSPDYGEFTEPYPNSVPVFWGCGVTPQSCLTEAKLPLVITHSPGSMLITDLRHNEVLTAKQNIGVL